MTSWFLYLHRYSWGVIKPDIKTEFGLTDIQLGWLDSVFNIAYALCQVPTGLLGDVLGPAIVLPVIIATWSGLAAAPAVGTGFWSFAGLRTVFGVAQAGCYPNLGKVTHSWFPPSDSHGPPGVRRLVLRSIGRRVCLHRRRHAPHGLARLRLARRAALDRRRRAGLRAGLPVAVPGQSRRSIHGPMRRSSA